MRKPYATDLTDAQWELVAPHIPRARRGGAPRRVDIREVVNAVLYITRTGCQWRLLPHEFPSWRTVHTYFSEGRNNGTWVRLCDALRERRSEERRVGKACRS